MLKKLFVNDFCAIGRRTFPLLLALVGASILSFGIVLTDRLIPDTSSFAESFADLMTGVLLLVFFGSVALLAISVLHIFLHYYRNFFTDEGYLTFSVPATMEQHLVAKILAGVAFLLIISLVGMLAFTVGILFSFELAIQYEGTSFLPAFFRSFDGAFPSFFLIDTLLRSVAQLVWVYTAITLGSLLFGKRRVLGSIVFYLLTNSLTSVVRTGASALLNTFVDEGSVFAALLSILLSFALGVGGYLITRYLLNHKLNLI